MPNMVASIIPATYQSAVTPTYFKGMIDSTTFFVSSGQYFFLLLCYASWAILISILKNKGINKWRKLRKFAKGVFERRIRFGAVQESLWFCYMSFVFFGLWQMKEMTVSESWTYANIVTSVVCWVICVMLTIWVVRLSIKYKNDLTKLPKKYNFILGEDSHIPF